jgi:hypothetical protein
MEPASLADPVLREALRMASSNLPTSAQVDALALKVSVATAAGGGGFALGKWLASKAGLVKLTAVVALTGAATWWVVSESHAPRAVQRAHVAVHAPPVESPPTLAAKPAEPAPSAQLAVPVKPPTPDRAPEHDDALTPSAAAPTLTPARTERSVRARASASTRKMTASAAHAMHDPASVATSPAPAPALSPSPAQRASAPSASPSGTSAPPSELSLLGEAQSLLQRDPARALETTDEHRRSYPRGAYSEEREALAIDALRRLGRHGEAAARARAFLQSYPSSPHRERILTWLQ